MITEAQTIMTEALKLVAHKQCIEATYETNGMRVFGVQHHVVKLFPEGMSCSCRREYCEGMACVAIIYNPEGAGAIANGRAIAGAKSVRLENAVRAIRMTEVPGQFTIPHHYSDVQARRKLHHAPSTAIIQ